jgi:hypothetical protein
MTHGPPKYILDLTGDNRSPGCEHLRRAIARAKPRLHCFGHLHQRASGHYEAQRLEYGENGELDGDAEPISRVKKDWVRQNSSCRNGCRKLSPGDAESFRDSKQTLCVNAAMEHGKGLHPPWLVNLDLPV